MQSVGDPTSGLIAQPVRSLLRSWGESPAALGALMALLAVPWTIKPTFGLLSDFVPLLGSRRRSYLLVANGLAATSLLLLALVPLAPESRWLLFVLVRDLFRSSGVWKRRATHLGERPTLRPFPTSLRNSHSGPGNPLSARSPDRSRHANCHSLVRTKVNRVPTPTAMPARAALPCGRCR